MKTTLQSLQESIANAVDIIDQSQLVGNDLLLQQYVKTTTVSLDFTNANSLLDKCEQVIDSYKKSKPVIRVIHHLACSGGTLFSKCLAAMPNTFLLSEVHPYSDLHLDRGASVYLPTDIISLSRYADIPDVEQLAGDIFTSNIIKTSKHVSSYAGSLILRDHTHFDFCIGARVALKPAVFSLLESHFEIRNLVTIRNPIDSYLSLEKNNWKHFDPFSFEEYCRRFIEMTKFYSKSDIYRYEDFVKEPSLTMQKMCVSLDLPYSDCFLDIFELFRVTGNSGRSSPVITEMPRGELSPEFLLEVQASSSFQRIIKKFDY